MLNTFVLILILFLVFPKQTFAYLDPGTGSYITQIVIGLLLGGTFFLRNFLKSFVSSISSFFSKLLSQKKNRKYAGILVAHK